MKSIEQTQQEIGATCARRRIELGMGQSELAQYCGIGITTISAFENGKGNITLKALLSIMDTLGLHVSIGIKK